ncbi:hypothetical protein OG2516_18060 [Oceanicola granulosus HTCC2516]|uniref:Xylose isomerase-like TIM barrel domain-containing protein n=2 Tax=Oceanicola granulosus TaxID=252302 RepID=Q2CEN2_OCEGH|nr:hypothetical protein OG2516_18060 [Oceanicola granulosus HTCC2516]
MLSNAPVSWGVYHAEGAPLSAARYLDEIAAAGYGGTELGPIGFMPEDPARLAEMLAARDLSLVGAVIVHDFSGPEAALTDMLDRVGPLLASGGAKVATVMDAGQGTPGSELEARVAAAMTRATRHLRDRHGLALAFHPHVLTAIETEAQVDRLLETSEAGLCLDTGHHAFWGEDPLAYLDKARERLSAVHLKNVDERLVTEVAAGRLSPAAATRQGAFCPLADGVVDIPAFLRRLGPFEGPVVVEQDWTPAAAEPPLALARRNADFLAGAVVPCP